MTGTAMRLIRGFLAVFVACGTGLAHAPSASAQQPDGYARASSGTRVLTLGSGTSIKMMLDATNLGSGEIERGEGQEPVLVSLSVPGFVARLGHVDTSVEALRMDAVSESGSTTGSEQLVPRHR